MTIINPSPSRKKHKNCSASPRDRLSQLPNDVLGLVLSSMPIKEAVRTCVLSKDWEFKWNSISKLNIDIEDFPRESTNALTFVCNVERVLFHLYMLMSFSLSCSCPENSELSRILMLISAVLRRNIRRLRLVITENQAFVLPRSLLNCDSLRELHFQFGMPCSFRVPVNNHFPNLKNLFLGGVMINEISEKETLVFKFPVLKGLELKECTWVKVKVVSIYAPSLRKFTSETPYEENNNIDYSIELHGAKIAELNTYGGYPENIILIGSTVDVVNLECYFFDTILSLYDCGLRVRKLLRQVSSAKQLCVMDALLAIGQTKLELSIPKFCNLKVMQMSIPVDGEGLLELLNASPFLEELELVLHENEDDYLLENVPLCVVHHLKKITIYYVSMNFNSDYAYRIEKFLLKHGTQLKIVSIQTLGESPEKQMLDKFMEFMAFQILIG